MTSPTSESKRRSSTERYRAFAERKRRGQSLFTIRLTQRELGQLEAGGYLRSADRDNREAVIIAIQAALSDKLESLT